MVASSGALAEGNPASQSKSSPHTTVTIDPEFMSATAPSLEVLATIAQRLPFPVPTTAHEIRANTEILLPAMLERAAATAGNNLDTVLETTHSIPSFDGAEITVTHLATAAQRAAAADLGSSSEPPRGRAVLHIHGGGFVTGSVDMFASITKRNVLAWDTPIFAVGYRVAPENPAPGPVEDAYAALKWLSTHAAELGVDPARIVIVGESAGGGVAAGLALVARDRGLSPPLAKVMLIYPMLDDRTIGKYDGVDWPTRPYLSWTEAQNKIGWRAYLGEDKAGKADVEVSVYDAPGRATIKDLVGLPSTYVDTGSLDLFRDEDIAFAARLSEADVQAEFHLYPGLPHGFETSVTPALVKSALENRKRAICSI